MNCPNRKVNTSAEWEAVKGGEIKDEKEEDVADSWEENQEEVDEEVDDSEILVLRRVLSGQKDAKDEQRENFSVLMYGSGSVH